MSAALKLAAAEGGDMTDLSRPEAVVHKTDAQRERGLAQRYRISWWIREGIFTPAELDSIEALGKGRR